MNVAVEADDMTADGDTELTPPVELDVSAVIEDKVVVSAVLVDCPAVDVTEEGIPIDVATDASATVDESSIVVALELTSATRLELWIVADEEGTMLSILLDCSTGVV